jgi:hypothetical protein
LIVVLCGLVLSLLLFAIIVTIVVPLVDIVTVAAITVTLAALILFISLAVVVLTDPSWLLCGLALSLAPIAIIACTRPLGQPQGDT